MSDKIAQIRARHEAGSPGEVPIAALCQCDADREVLLAEVDRLRAEIKITKAAAWDEGYQDHKDMIEGTSRKPSNPYR